MRYPLSDFRVSSNVSTMKMAGFPLQGVGVNTVADYNPVYRIHAYHLNNDEEMAETLQQAGLTVDMDSAQAPVDVLVSVNHEGLAMGFGDREVDDIRAKTVSVPLEPLYDALPHTLRGAADLSLDNQVLLTELLAKAIEGALSDQGVTFTASPAQRDRFTESVAKVWCIGHQFAKPRVAA